MSGARAVFLDRDGVLLEPVLRDGRPFPAASGSELQLVPGAPEACGLLRQAGFKLVMVTNQPDVARGRTTEDEVHAINDRLRKSISLDAALVCFHDDDDGCGCRKPHPGLLLDAAGRFSLSLERSVMVGDRWRDIEAGRRAGCRTVFIDRGYRERQPEAPQLTAPSLLAAVPWILATCGSDHGATP